jgi:hypothetical protein
MNYYNDWLKNMARLSKEAEFCLVDVTERISAGDKTIEFLITEDEGYDRVGHRRGQNTFRTRVYLECPGAATNARIEINDNAFTSIDKITVADWGFSVQEMFLFNRSIFEGVYQSLKDKIAVVGESSKALLEAALGEQITKLITARLQGEDVSGDIRKMLHEHIREIISDKVAPGVKIASYRTAITKLGIRKDADFNWDFEREDDNDFNLKIRWKSLHYGYQGRNQNVWLMNQEATNFCVRDAFLFSINLPAFGEQIAQTIKKFNTQEA